VCKTNNQNEQGPRRKYASRDKIPIGSGTDPED
jgi:hypothetical protein